MIHFLTDIKPEWHNKAACRDRPKRIFFPERGETTKKAKEICQHCPVVNECLEDALTQTGNLAGIWGGTSVGERRKIIKYRGSTA